MGLKQMPVNITITLNLRDLEGRITKTLLTTINYKQQRSNYVHQKKKCNQFNNNENKNKIMTNWYQRNIHGQVNNKNIMNNF